MTIRIGVIAEDQSDVDIFDALTRKIAKKDYAIRKFVGHGCGKIKKDCFQWAQNLREQKCSLLILIHDLDNNKYSNLEQELIKALSPSPIKNNLVVIPIKEIEAWLLSDENAIQSAMNLKNKVPRIPNPENIENPKEYLGRLVEQKSGGSKHYLNTVHNKKIASTLSIEEVRRCKSFFVLEQFLVKHI